MPRQRYIRVVGVLATLLLLTGCTDTGMRMVDNGRSSTQSSTQTAPALSGKGNALYSQFTVEALDEYVRNNLLTTMEGVEYEENLGLGHIKDHGSVALSDTQSDWNNGTVSNPDSYYVTYACRQKHPGSFSLYINRGNENKHLVTEESCNQSGVMSVRYPIAEFADADSISLRADSGIEIIIAVYEITKE